MSKEYFFTSESVSEGHPDKVADQVSDAIVDVLLSQDPKARIACETMVNTSMAIISGEISTATETDFVAVARRTIRDIGYTGGDTGYDADKISVLLALNKQSPDIAMGVDETTDHEQGAGDQGLMFGYACNEVPTLMPAPIDLAHKLVRRQAELRKSGKIPWLSPDAKSQVTFLYKDNKPVSIDAVVLSTQHAPDISLETLREAVIEEIIKPLVSPWGKLPTCHVNPTGRFVIGGPVGDCGLTGRKIIVDTYGGMARHGGGAFSGKDPSKVDRSATYAVRHVAKNIVAASLADRCEVQLSYAIGVADPVSISVETFGTGKLPDQELVKLVNANFDLRPKGIIADLGLLKPLYQPTASYGHFGREDLDLPWERTDKAKKLAG